jgi:cytochrome c553
MKSKVIVGILGACGLAATLTYGALPHQQAGKTVADGVYTSPQADRGMQTVEDYGCRNCHGAELEGGKDEQPQLVGEEFVSAWTGRKLDELAEKITTMPADQGEAYHVKPAAAPDVVAYLLRANGYPAGTAELPADPKTLKLIEIVAP